MRLYCTESRPTPQRNRRLDSSLLASINGTLAGLAELFAAAVCQLPTHLHVLHAAFVAFRPPVACVVLRPLACCGLQTLLRFHDPLGSEIAIMPASKGGAAERPAARRCTKVNLVQPK